MGAIQKTTRQQQDLDLVDDKTEGGILFDQIIKSSPGRGKPSHFAPASHTSHSRTRSKLPPLHHGAPSSRSGMYLRALSACR